MNDLIVALLDSLANWLGGSLGWGIVVLSLGIRVALLPLTIWLFYRTRRNQETIQRLQPEIEKLKQQYQKQPERMLAEVRELYRKHDCNLFDLPALIGGFIQLPIFGILYNAIRSSLTSNSTFLWIKNLAAPDFLLTVVILFLTGMCAYFMPSASEQMRGILMALQLVVIFFMVWKLAAGLGLYWASSGLIGALQTLWLRHRDHAPRKA